MNDDDGVGVMPMMGLLSISSWCLTRLLVIGGSIRERRRGREDEEEKEEGICG